MGPMVTLGWKSKDYSAPTEESVSLVGKSTGMLETTSGGFAPQIVCILGKVKGIEVTFLIYSGASECFLSTTFIEQNKLKIAKAKEN